MNRNTLRIAGIVLALLVSWLAAPAMAQQPVFKDALLDHFVGKWVLKGTVENQAVVHDVEANWALGHQYLCFHEVSRERAKDGSPLYEAAVYIGWNEKPAEYVCSWLDVYGGITPMSVGHAVRAGNDIPFIFRDGDTTFYTTLSYLPESDTWKWKMDEEQKGVLSPFGRMTLTRLKP